MTIQDRMWKFTIKLCRLGIKPSEYVSGKKKKSNSLSRHVNGGYVFQTLLVSSTNKRDLHLNSFKSIHSLNLGSCLSCLLYT